MASVGYQGVFRHEKGFLFMISVRIFSILFRMKTFRNKSRGNKNKSKSRKMKGSGFFDSIFGAFSTGPPPKAQMHSYTNANAPFNPGAGFTRTSFGIAPGLNYSYSTNAYGHKQAGLTGAIPAAFGLASVAHRIANPPAEGIFGLKGNASEFSKYPNPYKDLAVSFTASNAEIKAAYNNKMRTANNSQKKVINDAYATLSDPSKKAKYNADAKVFFSTHKPTPGDLVAIYSSGTPEQQQMVKQWKQLGL